MKRAVVLACGVFAFATRADAAEICGDKEDNDHNGMTDEGCYPSMRTGVCESPLSCTDTGWVSWSTGSLHYDLPPDVAPKSPWGPDIELRRFYTSMYAPPSTPSSFNRTPLGGRWQHNYMSWLDRQPDGNIVIHTPQGEDVLAVLITQPTEPDPEQPPGPVFDEIFRPQSGQQLRLVHHHSGRYRVGTQDGGTLSYNEQGQLFEVADAASNTVKIAWTNLPGGSVVSTVTDATTKRRLLFNYNAANRLDRVELQFGFGTSPVNWVSYHKTIYNYVADALSTVLIGEQSAQTNVYANGYLTQVKDADGKQLVAFKYDALKPGATSLIDIDHGTVGFELDSPRTTCTGKTVLYFNKANTNACSVDADCGTGALCGGKTSTAGSTGTCFRAARCMTIDTTSHEGLVTSVSALGPPSEQCTGACAAVTQYVWNTAADLAAVKDAGTIGSYTTAEYNNAGQPTKIVYADTDVSAQNGGGRTVWLYYSSVGLVEVRRPSVMSNSASCSATSVTGCARTLYEYDRGQVSLLTQIGYTLGPNGSIPSFSHTTRATYDAVGRMTLLDGPVSGSSDATLFAYNPSNDPIQGGFLGTRTSNGTIPTLGTPLVERVYAYDIWGNATDWVDVDNTRTCNRYNTARNYLEMTSEKMSTSSTCAGDDAADLVVSYTRDSALRLTQTKAADGSCFLYEYDARGRLARTKRRDDCLAASAGDREEYTYDHDGLLTEVATYDAADTVTRKSLASYYDSRQLQGMMNPVDASKVSTLTYDARGVLVDLTAPANLGHTQFAVDPDYRLTSVTHYNTPATAESPWKLSHDGIGQFTGVTDPDNKAIVAATYDDLGRRVRFVSPDQTAMQVDMTFTPIGRLETSTDPMQQTKYTYDALGRLLTADFQGKCSTLSPENEQPIEAENQYDAVSSCPSPNHCSNLRGRLAYSRVTLMCSPDYTDGALDQYTFYSYDAAGRVIAEYIVYDSDPTHVLEQKYAWTKGGDLAQVSLPSSSVVGWTYGSAANNSDTDLVTAMWRTSTATPIVDTARWKPYGPLAQYNRRDTISGSLLRTRFEYNLAYRTKSIQVEGQTFGGPYYRLLVGEDAKGRVTSRDYYPSDPQMTGVFDSYFIYDGQDRVLCETTTPAVTCPTTGTNIKNSHPAAFTGAGDRKTLIRPIPGSDGGTNHAFVLAPGTHRIASVVQGGGTTPLGTTTYVYDEHGNRTSEDNAGARTQHDRREYTYGGRGNVTAVRGMYPVGTDWHDYSMQSAFDARNRRVFKAFVDLDTMKQKHWYFYYDPYDRLTEVRYTPDISTPETYTTYQMFWLDGRLTAYWQTDFPTGTTSKRYVSSDENGRPVRMHSWTTSNSLVVWAIDPDAYGMDKTVIGPSIYQPIAFAGQYVDAETASYLDDAARTRNRPPLVLNGFRTYDPFTGSYLQLDPLVEETWSPYAYADGNPVGKSDPLGLEVIFIVGEPCWDGDDREMCWHQTGEPLFNSSMLGGAGGGGGPRTGIGGGVSPQKKPPAPPKKAPPKKRKPYPDLSKTTCAEDLAFVYNRDFKVRFRGEQMAVQRLQDRPVSSFDWTWNPNWGPTPHPQYQEEWRPAWAVRENQVCQQAKASRLSIELSLP